jgi:hypothetical protein
MPHRDTPRSTHRWGLTVLTALRSAAPQIRKATQHFAPSTGHDGRNDAALLLRRDVQNPEEHFTRATRGKRRNEAARLLSQACGAARCVLLLARLKGTHRFIHFWSLVRECPRMTSHASLTPTQKRLQ